MDILIDATEYCSDPGREGPYFKVLTRLAQAGRVTLHVPYVARREFVSKQEHTQHEQFMQIRRALKALRRTGAPRHSLRAVEKALDKLITRSEGSTSADFRRWLASAKAKTHPIRPGHGRQVMNWYFDGTGSFREAKHREDIPDAFIYATVTDLFHSHPSLVFISHDSRFRTRVSDHGVRCYPSIKDFVESAEVRAIRSSLFEEANTAALALLATDEPNLIAKSVRAAITRELPGLRVTSELIPDDNHEAFVDMIHEVNRPSFDNTAIENMGNGLFVLTTTVTAICDLSYAIFKADLGLLPDDKSDRINISDRNRHYFEATETYELEMKGEISADATGGQKLADEELSNDTLRNLLKKATIRVESLECVGAHEADW